MAVFRRAAIEPWRWNKLAPRVELVPHLFMWRRPVEKATVNRQLLKRKADTLSEPEAAEVLEYIGIMEFLRDDQSDALTETIARLLCEAMIGAPESHQSKISPRPAEELKWPARSDAPGGH